MLLKLEDYHSDLHDYVDDCDYVISFDDMHEDYAWALVKEMGYDTSNVLQYSSDCTHSGYGEFYLCHA